MECKSKAKNNHQILYAKNFYAYSGDVIADMKKVCALDNPEWNFSSPKQTLKFMRREYAKWIEENPSLNCEIDSRVAWDDNPISGEMWSILISYQTYIPMTMIGGYISELPRYDVLQPQYNATCDGFGHLFRKSMDVKELTAKAEKFLSITPIEILDTLAEGMLGKFDFGKASELLGMFGKKITAEDLDDELWRAYSYLVEDIMDGGEVLPDGFYTVLADDFSLNVRSGFRVNSSFEIDMNLIPFKFSCESEDIATEENILEELEKCFMHVLDQFVESGAFRQISDVCAKLLEEGSDAIWDVPNTLIGDEKELRDYVLNNIGPKDTLHGSFGYYSRKDVWERFSQSDNLYSPFSYGSGCFMVYVYNDSGRVRMVVTFETLFECNIMEKSLSNGMWIDGKKK